jgi:hypothetical protein
MNTAIRNDSNRLDTLRARKTHLITLLKIVDCKPIKTTAIQSLTTNAIKAELTFIEHQLNRRS